MVQYYTLEQAAQILNMTPEALKEMARKNQVRAFQDRGSLRFQAHIIDEMARARGLGSDPELPLGEAARSTSGPTSSARRRASAPPPVDDDEGSDTDFTLNIDDEVPVGKDNPHKSGPRSTPPSRKTGASKSSLSRSPQSPPPKRSSDSDVRLVMDGSDLDFQIEIDSDVKVPRDPASSPGRTSSGKHSSKLRVPPPDQPADSGVRIVPLDEPSDSDVKIVPAADDAFDLGDTGPKSPSDSDIRMERIGPPPPPSSGEHDPLITEEIDLDDEARKAEESSKKRRAQKPSGPSAKLPTSSPFELSEDEFELELEEPAAAPSPTEDSSSDFELTPANAADLSPIELSSGELPAAPPADDDEVSLGELSGATGASGINLQDPVDSGISLEQGGSDEIAFDLSLDAGATPKPSEQVDSSGDFELSLDEGPPAEDSTSSEFELSLDESAPPDLSPVDAESSSSEFELSLEEEGATTADGSDSEFELSLDVEGSSSELEAAAEDGSSSEFELTLDDSGSLAPVQEEAAGGEDKDIFETDFEVPALEEESGSEAVALNEGDTDLESSDFDLSLEEGEAAGEEESGSQVVTLDEDEEADEAAATVARPKARAAKSAVAEEEEEAAEDEGDLDISLDTTEEEEGEEEAEEEAEEEVAVGKPARAAAVAAPAPWGVLPALLLLPTLIVLVVVGLMSYELVQGANSYHRTTKPSNLIIDNLARQFEDLPKP